MKSVSDIFHLEVSVSPSQSVYNPLLCIPFLWKKPILFFMENLCVNDRYYFLMGNPCICDHDHYSLYKPAVFLYKLGIFLVYTSKIPIISHISLIC